MSLLQGPKSADEADVLPVESLQRGIVVRHFGEKDRWRRKGKIDLGQRSGDGGRQVLTNVRAAAMKECPIFTGNSHEKALGFCPGRALGRLFIISRKKAKNGLGRGRKN